jgi:Fe-S cluster biogenesis protein NfuA
VAQFWWTPSRSRASPGVPLGPGFAEATAGHEDAVVERIRRILDEEIRPAVAMDGGDIVFAGFRDGIVELYLQGSCHGCPSSTLTLKMGIEQRLREEIPEVQGVEAV